MLLLAQRGRGHGYVVAVVGWMARRFERLHESRIAHEGVGIATVSSSGCGQQRLAGKGRQIAAVQAKSSSSAVAMRSAVVRSEGRVHS